MYLIYPSYYGNRNTFVRAFRRPDTACCDCPSIFTRPVQHNLIKAMKLTLFSDYSLRILMFAALRNDRKFFHVDEAAAAYGLSRHHTAKVVNFLALKAAICSLNADAAAASALAANPKEICIGQLVRQTETGSPLVECFDAASNTCPLIHACLLKHALGQAWTAFFKTLDGYTLADLIHKPDPLHAAALALKL